jgi:uncharacterized membrane protein YeaQ/YmgE (transglycosylase-associated protein family)
MVVGSFLSWILLGSIITLFVRRLFPNRQSMRLMTTMILGIAAAVMSGFLYSLVRGAPAAPASVYGEASLPAVIGAFVVLCAHSSGLPQEVILVISRARQARKSWDH